MKRIAIIGAGLSGLITAKRLSKVAEITIFEKARGVGGRMSTRYAGDYRFDHGAQYFTLKQDTSRAVLQDHLQDGTIERWNAAYAEFRCGEEVSRALWQEGRPRYTAAPNMNSLCKALATELDVRLQTKITAIEGDAGHWQLTDDTGTDHRTFDWVVISAPAPQTAVLMPDSFAMHDAIAAAQMAGCFALMVGLAETPNMSWQAAQISESPLAWMALNSSKPGRKDDCSIVLQARNDWSDDHIEAEPGWVRDELLREGSRIVGTDLSQASCVQMHRWRYANVVRPAASSLLLDSANQLAACGDWCIEGKVEGAIQSALALSHDMKALL